MTTATITYTWDGEAFVPRSRFAKICDRIFVVGADYPLVVEEPRSSASHRHFFAQVTDLWRNLPEHLSEDFPSSEHLRKYALIKAGYCDKRSIVCASKAEALRIAAFIEPIDEYALVTVSEAVVTVYTAQSQSTRAMGAKVFQQSKDAVFDFIARLVGVDVETAKRQAGQAA